MDSSSSMVSSAQISTVYAFKVVLDCVAKYTIATVVLVIKR